MSTSNGHAEAALSISRRYARLPASAAAQLALFDILLELRGMKVEPDEMSPFLAGFLWRHDLTGRQSAGMLRQLSPVVAEWARDACALTDAEVELTFPIWTEKARGDMEDRAAATKARRHA